MNKSRWKWTTCDKTEATTPPNTHRPIWIQAKEQEAYVTTGQDAQHLIGVSSPGVFRWMPVITPEELEEVFRVDTE